MINYEIGDKVKFIDKESIYYKQLSKEICIVSYMESRDNITLLNSKNGWFFDVKENQIELMDKLPKQEDLLKEIIKNQNLMLDLLDLIARK